MTREEMMDNLGNNLEKERIALHFSQSQMAEALDMSLSSYKRIISGETNRIDFYTIYLMYKLTNKFSYELCGIPIPDVMHCRDSPPPSSVLSMVSLILRKNFRRTLKIMNPPMIM